MGFKQGNDLGKKFEPGQSGNPSGLPKGYKSFRTRIRELAEKEIDYKDLDNKKTRMSAGEALILSLYGKAVYKGDTQAAKALMEHGEGKKLEIGNDEDKPFKIHLEEARRQAKELSPAKLEAMIAIMEAEDE